MRHLNLLLLFVVGLLVACEEAPKEDYIPPKEEKNIYVKKPYEKEVGYIVDEMFWGEFDSLHIILHNPNIEYKFEIVFNKYLDWGYTEFEGKRYEFNSQPHPYYRDQMSGLTFSSVSVQDRYNPGIIPTHFVTNFILEPRVQDLAPSSTLGMQYEIDGMVQWAVYYPPGKKKTVRTVWGYAWEGEQHPSVHDAIELDLMPQRFVLTDYQISADRETVTAKGEDFSFAGHKHIRGRVTMNGKHHTIMGHNQFGAQFFDTPIYYLRNGGHIRFQQADPTYVRDSYVPDHPQSPEMLVKGMDEGTHDIWVTIGKKTYPVTKLKLSGKSDLAVYCKVGTFFFEGTADGQYKGWYILKSENYDIEHDIRPVELELPYLNLPGIEATLEDGRKVWVRSKLRHPLEKGTPVKG